MSCTWNIAKSEPCVVQCWDGARKQGGGGVRHPGYTHVCSLVYSAPGKDWEILVLRRKKPWLKFFWICFAKQGKNILPFAYRILSYTTKITVQTKIFDKNMAKMLFSSWGVKF